MRFLGSTLVVLVGAMLVEGCGGSSGGGGPSPTSSFSVTTTSLASTTVGDSYNEQLSTANGSAPYSWTVISGSLPTGLDLDASNGAIAGTVGGSSGTYDFSVRVTDGAGQQATRALTIEVSPEPVEWVAGASQQIPDGVVGQTYSFDLANIVDNGVTPYTFSVSGGSLPSGLNLSSDGSISGTPTQTGTTSVILRVESSPDPNTGQVSAADLGTDVTVNNTAPSPPWELVHTAPSVTRIPVLAISPSDPQILYAGADSPDGMYKTENGGTTWSQVNNGLPFPGGIVDDVVIDPGNPSVAYAATNAGVFVTTNGGTNWSAINTGLTSLSCRDLALDPTNTQVLYVTTPDGVFKTSNAGTSWSLMNTGLETHSYGRVLAMAPASPQLLLAASTGICRTTDGAANWVETTPNLNGSASDIVFHPNDPQQAYLCHSSAGLRKTSNAGDDQFAAGVGFAGMGIVSMAIDPQTPTTLYVALASGFQKSTDEGANWTAINSGIGAINQSAFAIVIDPQATNVVFVTVDNKIYKTTTGGQ